MDVHDCEAIDLLKSIDSKLDKVTEMIYPSTVNISKADGANVDELIEQLPRHLKMAVGASAKR